MNLGQLETIEKEQSVYLTTVGRTTGKAHTVELWFAVADGVVYLSHEGARTDWMRNLDKQGKVGVKIGKLSFEAEARVAKSGASREAGKGALYLKYYGPASQSVIDDWFSLSEVIELRPL
jgi:deazaflavin-dependent oxidoreductase (nitroreductase family)